MEQEQKTIHQQLQEIVDDICENYCKYPPAYIGLHPGEDVDMIEDMMYQEICAKCPLLKI